MYHAWLAWKALCVHQVRRWQNAHCTKARVEVERQPGRRNRSPAASSSVLHTALQSAGLLSWSGGSNTGQCAPVSTQAWAFCPPEGFPDQPKWNPPLRFHAQKLQGNVCNHLKHKHEIYVSTDTQRRTLCDLEWEQPLCNTCLTLLRESIKHWNYCRTMSHQSSISLVLVNFI